MEEHWMEEVNHRSYKVYLKMGELDPQQLKTDEVDQMEVEVHLEDKKDDVLGVLIPLKKVVVLVAAAAAVVDIQ